MLWRIEFDEPRFAEEDEHHFSFGTAYKVKDMPDDPMLGLATTQQLLDEIAARIEVSGVGTGRGLDYRTIDG